MNETPDQSPDERDCLVKAGFTTPQASAFYRVAAILGEHFHGAVFAVVAEIEEDREEVRSWTSTGSNTTAIGLAEWLRVKIMQPSCPPSPTTDIDSEDASSA